MQSGAAESEVKRQGMGQEGHLATQELSGSPCHPPLALSEEPLLTSGQHSSPKSQPRAKIT
jgi:hypothetical protein